MVNEISLSLSLSFAAAARQGTRLKDREHAELRGVFIQFTGTWFGALCVFVAVTRVNDCHKSSLLLITTDALAPLLRLWFSLHVDRDGTQGVRGASRSRCSGLKIEAPLPDLRCAVFLPLSFSSFPNTTP